MNNRILFQLGDINVIHYQKIVIYFGITLIASLIAIGYLQKENYLFNIALFTTIAWLIILYLYSNIYEVALTDTGFQIKNFLNNRSVDPMKFLEIRRAKILGIILIIVFTDRKFYFLMKSEDFLRDFIFKDDEIVRKLNVTLVEKIKKMKDINVEFIQSGARF